MADLAVLRPTLILPTQAGAVVVVLRLIACRCGKLISFLLSELAPPSPLSSLDQLLTVPCPGGACASGADVVALPPSRISSSSLMRTHHPPFPRAGARAHPPCAVVFAAAHVPQASSSPVCRRAAQRSSWWPPRCSPCAAAPVSGWREGCAFGMG